MTAIGAPRLGSVSRRCALLVVGLTAGPLLASGTAAGANATPTEQEAANSRADEFFRDATRAVDRGRPEAAIELLLRARELAPQRLDILLDLAALLERSGRGLEALGVYRDALEVAPDSVEATENLAAILAANGDLEGAIWLLERSLLLRPEAASLHYHLGLLRLRQEQEPDPEAIRSLERARELGFDEPHLYLLLGRVSRLRSGAAAALELLESGLERSPDDQQLLREQGRALAELGRHAAAAAVMRRAHEAQPHDLELAAELGRVLLNSGRALEALRLLEQHDWQHDPDLAYVVARARHVVGAAAADEAMDLYQRLAATRREEEAAAASAYAAVRAGIVAWGEGDVAAAGGHFAAADQYRPGWPLALSYLATAWLALGRTDEALAVAQDVLDSDPGNSQALIVVGKARLVDDPAAALAALQEAVTRYPFRKACLLALAEAYLALGREADALRWLRRVGEVDPGDAWVRERVGTLEGRVPRDDREATSRPHVEWE